MKKLLIVSTLFVFGFVLMACNSSEEPVEEPAQEQEIEEIQPMPLPEPEPR